MDRLGALACPRLRGFERQLSRSLRCDDLSWFGVRIRKRMHWRLGRLLRRGLFEVLLPALAHGVELSPVIGRELCFRFPCFLECLERGAIIAESRCNELAPLACTRRALAQPELLDQREHLARR